MDIFDEVIYFFLKAPTKSCSIQDGFTLIELLLTISIMMALAIVVIPSALDARKKSYDAGAVSCAKSIQTAQAIAQVTQKTFLSVGSSSEQINRSADGIDIACQSANMYFNDRSNTATLQQDYVMDVWDIRGSKVVTVTPHSVVSGATGAAAFSMTGVGGSNLP